MDNNNPIVPAQGTPAPIGDIPSTPPPVASPVEMPSTLPSETTNIPPAASTVSTDVGNSTSNPKNNTGKMVMLITALIILVLGLLGGSYAYMTKATSVPAPVPRVITEPTPASSSSNFQKDLNAIDTGDVDKDFIQVDTDIQGL